MEELTKIKSEYIAGGISIKKLAKKYGVSENRLAKISAREKWTALRQKTGEKAAEKLTETIADAKIKKIERLTDELLAQSIRAVKQNDMVPKTERTTEEKEDGTVVVTVRTLWEKRKHVDKAGLRLLAQTTKDLLEIVRTLNGESDESREIRVTFAGDLEELAE